MLISRKKHQTGFSAFICPHLKLNYYCTWNKPYVRYSTLVFILVYLKIIIFVSTSTVTLFAEERFHVTCVK